MFSPNEDGINDAFTLYGDPQQLKQIVYLHIFDRWGERVFSRADFAPNDPTQGWNGRYVGEYVLPGVYVFVAEVLFVDGQRELIRDSVTVIR